MEIPISFLLWTPNPGSHHPSCPKFFPPQSLCLSRAHACTGAHTCTPDPRPPPPHPSSAFLSAGHWNVFLAQTPELKVTASPDKATKTL